MAIRILLAEDEPVIRMDLREELQRLGYAVVGEVGDGASAVQLARELRPDLVIACIRMPEMDGLAMAEILTRERVAPVLLHTAMSDDELVARACEAGVVGYVIKPWRLADMKPTIEVAVARAREQGQLEERVRTLEEQLTTRKVVERARDLLIVKYQLSPNDAFRRIQRQSMTKRISLRACAEEILLAESEEAPGGSVQGGADGTE
jgi:response regulator NasT